eukprot:CAMPEP_0198670664 /NCGR_PEP_ID=MMETSP1467-20131203/82194_1 /TAXON_ID=1462469 /ORGANISM="unid. sp., Strain CCMP2135" /LENGTH=170 /DNA_ID=CAMNT_0044407447 /DNA_START=21 /DNA_END=533 /DNA_ORIENTATION=+
MERNVDVATKLCGRDSVETRDAVTHLCYFFSRCHQYTDTEVLLRRHLKEPLEDNDWDELYEVLQLYSCVLMGLGRLAEAEELLRRGIRELSDEDRRGGAKATLARLLEQQGKTTESHELLSAVHSDFKRIYGPDHPMVISASAEVTRLSDALERGTGTACTAKCLFPSSA